MYVMLTPSTTTVGVFCSQKQALSHLHGPSMQAGGAVVGRRRSFLLSCSLRAQNTEHHFYEYIRYKLT